MSFQLWEAYRSIYAEQNSVQEELVEAPLTNARGRSASDRAAAAERLAKLKANPKDNAYVKKAPPKEDYGPWGQAPGEAKMIAKMDRHYDAKLAAKKKLRGESVEILFNHLLDEGFAETEEAALVLLTHMSEEWANSILESNQSNAK